MYNIHMCAYASMTNFQLATPSTNPKTHFVYVSKLNAYHIFIHFRNRFRSKRHNKSYQKNRINISISI